MTPDRREREVRRLLGEAHTTMPTDIASRATRRGEGLVRRRNALRAALWTLTVGAVAAFSVWAAVV